MGPYCALWLYGAGVPLAPCFGPWWTWGGASLHGVAWWGPWVEVPVSGAAGAGAGAAGAGGMPVRAGGMPLGAGGGVAGAGGMPLGARAGARTGGTSLSVLSGGIPGATGAGAGANPSGAPEAGGAPIQ